MRVFIFDISGGSQSYQDPKWLDNHVDIVSEFVDFMTDADHMHEPCLVKVTGNWLKHCDDVDLERIAVTTHDMLIECLAALSIFGRSDSGRIASMGLLATRPGDFMLEVSCE